jgi:hypothetical protein
MRLTGFLFLFFSFIAGALAQTTTAAPSQATISPAAIAQIKPGSYSGKVTEENGKGTADIKMDIKHVTADGRVTARVQSSHARAACAKSLPLNGIVLPSSEMRLEVDDGAPDGCERVYMLKLAGTGVSGTYIDAVTRVGGKLVPKKK